MATIIPTPEIRRHPLSFADPNATLFCWNGRLYRGIYPPHAPLVNKLFDCGLIDELVMDGLLVQTTRTALRAEHFPLIVEHRRLPFVTYPFEWTARMLRDAALLVLNLQERLLRSGLGLQDAHSWNVLWDGSRPVFVDLGSIVAFDGGPWTADQEFREFFLHPLRLMDQGYGRVARWLMHDMNTGVRACDLGLLHRGNGTPSTARTLGDVTKGIARRVVPAHIWSRARRASSGLAARRVPTAAESVCALRKSIDALELVVPPSAWSNYYNSTFPPLERDSSWTTKHCVVEDVLKRVSPNTVFDVGANRGWFAQLAAARGADVVTCDTDESTAALLYGDVARERRSVHPLVMDIISPSPGLGVNNQSAAPGTERLRCDVVLALALTHHLVFWRNLDFASIATALAAFTRRALVVEFVPREDEYVSQWIDGRHGWYTLENFAAALRIHFASIEVFPSDPPPRKLLLARMAG